MSHNKIELGLQSDHIGGGFEWELAPSCCDLLKYAFSDEKFLFVSNFVDGDPDKDIFHNQVYMMPLDSSGYLVKSSGLPIGFCPWCGTEIKVSKRYKGA